ncbi:MAG: Xanthine and dehydrogenase maturation factor, XdhC/CoxF family [Actinomycetia bacterium]|nr:Xanthine and dehydrogenase maturation factor, XdhC/CoxF family [Actinomycetes bacterium]
MSDVFAAVEEARREGRPVVMGTTVRTEGDPPSAPGNRALFAADGALLAGTIGCNGLDRKAGRDGTGLLAAGERSGLRAYTSFEGEPGEGVVEVFLEAFGGVPRLLVGGGGPVADALAAIGGIVGLAVQVEAPGTAAFEEASQGLAPGDAAVFVDHDDPALVPALEGLLAGRVGYLGVMGSRRHTPGFVARLRQTGADLGRLHSPTGLDLGARRPPEIALSILAEVLAVTRGRPAGSLDIVQRPSRQVEPEPHGRADAG